MRMKKPSKENLDLLKILAAIGFWFLVLCLSRYLEIWTPDSFTHFGTVMSIVGFYATLWLIYQGHQKLKTYFYSVQGVEWREHGRSKWQKFYCWVLFFD